MKKIWGISGICLLLLSIVSQCFSYTESIYNPTPGFQETATYAIGTCAVGVVCVQPPKGNWTKVMEDNALLIVREAFDYFENLSRGCIDFILAEVRHALTKYDPAEMVFYAPWVSDVMNNTGFIGNDDMDQTRRYVNYLRTNKTKADWAICVLMVDVTYTSNGNFGNGHPAFASAVGDGPYVAYAYTWNRSRLLLVHEVAHLFGATDEYAGGTEYAGYLYVPDSDGAKCLMTSFAYLDFCDATREQLGWRDVNGNNIMDIVENKDKTILQPYTPDPTTNRILRYNGTSYVIPYPSQNPKIRSVTITKIVNVEFRIDGGDWMNATPTDGEYDHAMEEFYFLTPFLQIGSHTIDVRSFNTVGDSDEVYASDTVQVIKESDVGSPKANFTCPKNITVGHSMFFDASASSSPNSTIISYGWDFGDGNKITASMSVISHVYDFPGNYTVVLNVTNAHGLWDATTALVSVWLQFLETDITGDGRVNLLDVFTAARAYNSHGLNIPNIGDPPSNNWNATADMNKDGWVNLQDIFRIARDFGKTV